MSDNNDRVVTLLEEMIRLQKDAAERQRTMLELTQQNYADARKRTEASIELQRVAVSRQKRFGRIWLGVLAPILIMIVVLFYWLARLAPHLRY